MDTDEQDDGILLAFRKRTASQLLNLARKAQTRDEQLLYLSLLDLKTGLAQEKSVGHELL